MDTAVDGIQTDLSNGTDGLGALKALIDALQDSPHTEPKSRLNHLIRLILDNNEPEEDSTIMVCKVTKTSVRMRDNLLAPLRLFRRPRDRTQLS